MTKEFPSETVTELQVGITSVLAVSVKVLVFVPIGVAPLYVVVVKLPDPVVELGILVSREVGMAQVTDSPTPVPTVPVAPSNSYVMVCVKEVDALLVFTV